MEEETFQKPSRGAHVLVLPCAAQGHMNPMLQFSKRLASKGLRVTVIVPSSASVQLSPPTLGLFGLDFIRLFDGFREGETTDDLDSLLDRQRASLSGSLSELLAHYKQNAAGLGPAPRTVVYDAFMPWVLPVVKKFHLQGAPFFTQSCVVNSIYYHVANGLVTSPMSKGSSYVSLPSVEGFLGVEDLPSFVSSPSVYPPIVKVVLGQFSNFTEADCFFVNTMDGLEVEVVNWMASQWAVKTIGPAIPSVYLDKRLPHDKDYGLSLFKPETDTCIEWLSTKGASSVVYVSMGSLASLGGDQLREIAMGLENSGKYFLWVVRASEESKLPSGFKEKTSEKGLVVSWCPQLEVLAHEALGCFVTHCGWNSTLEAISLGAPMVAVPQWTDQPTNAKCIMDFWKVGVRVRANDEGFVAREELESCIREVMEGERAAEIKRNASRWRELAREAMQEGGSSDRNIQEFVNKLLKS